MNMIDKVAKEICGHTGFWVNMDERTRQEYRGKALAAIEAMRDLSEEQLSKAYNAMYGMPLSDEEECNRCFTAGFNAVIDAALEE